MHVIYVKLEGVKNHCQDLEDFSYYLCDRALSPSPGKSKGSHNWVSTTSEIETMWVSILHVWAFRYTLIQSWHYHFLPQWWGPCPVNINIVQECYSEYRLVWSTLIFLIQALLITLSTCTQYVQKCNRKYSYDDWTTHLIKHDIWPWTN